MYETFWRDRLEGIIDKENGEITATCPFCGKPEHFYISKITGQYDCKVCNAQGNCITFLQEKESISNRNIPGILERYGIDGKNRLKLTTAKPLESYLEPQLVEKFEKAITAEAVKLFSKTYSPISIEVLRRHQIGKHGDYYTFPVYTPDGKLADIRRKKLGEKTQAWKGVTTYPFNISALNNNGKVYLCEGETSPMTLETQGYPAIGIPGANIFKDEWVPLFKNKEVIILYDVDDAGRNGARKVAEKLNTTAKSIKIINLPEELGKGGDIRDYFKNGGTKQKFEDLEKKAQKIETRKVPVVSEDYGDTLILKSPKGYLFQVSNFVTEQEGIRTNLRLLTENGQTIYEDRVIITGGYSRTKFIKKCIMMDVITLDEKVLENELIVIADLLRKKTVERIKKIEEEKAKTYEMTPEEKTEAMELLKNPTLLDIVISEMNQLGYVGEDLNKKIIYLIATSRKCRNTLSGIVKGQSGGGKSALVKTAVSMMPPEEVKDLSRITPQAMFYYEQEELQHKLIIVMERIGSESADYAIRTMQSEQTVVLDLPVKDPNTGLTKTKSLKVKGPISLIETTTHPQLNAENATRIIELYIDESEGQTKLIHNAQKMDKTLDGLLRKIEKERIKTRHQNAQRLLRPMDVVIPYAQVIDFPAHSVRARRDHDRFLNIIATIAFLYQYQHQIKLHNKTEYIEANLEDYKLAYELAPVIFGPASDELEKKSRELLVKIAGNLKEKDPGLNINTFTRKDIEQWTRWPYSEIHIYMGILVDRECIEVEQGGQGKRYTYKYIYQGDPSFSTFKGVTTPEELEQKLIYDKQGTF